MVRLLDYLATIGLAYYAYAVVDHAVQDTGLFAIIVGVALVVFLLRHYGRDFARSVGRFFSDVGNALVRVGDLLTQGPERLRGLFNPPTSSSSLDRLVWETRFNRRVTVVSTFVIALLLVGMLVAIRPTNDPTRHVRNEPNTPPPATQPFDKKWVAPGEKKGIGGEGKLDVPPPASNAQPESGPSLSAPSGSLEQRKAHGQRERKMKDPWDFPKF